MERTEIIANIKSIIEETADIAPEDVSEESAMMDDLDLSSMEVMTMVAELEDTFHIRIPENELRNFITVADLADYLTKMVG